MICAALRRMTAAGPWLLLIFLLLPGCAKEELPKTYLVKGKVVHANGKPFKGGGMITFTSVDNNDRKGYGVIDGEGAFTLNTVALRSDATSEMLNGAVVGDFYVNVRPTPGGNMDDGSGGPPVGGGKSGFTLKEKYKIEAKELNELTVTVK